MSTKIWVNTTVVGYVTGRDFMKFVSSERHFLHTPPAIAFDVSTLDDAEKVGANRVIVHDRDTRNVYSAPISLVREMGFSVDRKCGQQIALALAYFSVNGNQPVNTPGWNPRAPKTSPQARLF